jgi:CelD/BcsL family acetyltransferase involved in cellulose biosynthesis
LPSLTVAQESFEALATDWKALLPNAATNTIFLTPEWQQLWWQHFSAGEELQILSVREVGGRLIAVAPLRRMARLISLVGSTDVCDYSDFILDKSCAGEALTAVIEHVRGWDRVVLNSVPAGVPTLALLPQIAEKRGWKIEVTQEDVCPRAELPGDWEEYLGRLSKKDRHELRRKFRRLDSAGQVSFPLGNGDKDMDDFFRLHRLSREDKAEFMTPDMEAFFRQVMVRIADSARLQFVEVDGVRAAAIVYFDYAGRRLLYNSGYDPAFSSLSVGLLLKAYAVREAIESGMSCFDFLRGDEPYKYDLGGVDFPIYRCEVTRTCG